MTVHPTRATGRLGNEAWFGRFEDYVALLREQGLFSRSLDGMPAGCMWFYRSSDVHGTNSYGRLNSCIYVFCPARFADEEAAQTMLDKTGLVPVIERLKGNILLISPEAETWQQPDADALMKLERAALESLLDHFGSFGTNYYIGIESGADFIHNFVATIPELADRCAAALCIGGRRDAKAAATCSSTYGLTVGGFPAILLDADEDTRKAYLALKGFAGAAQTQENGFDVFTAKANEMLQLRFGASTGDLAKDIQRGFFPFMRSRMRLPIAPGRNAYADSNYFAICRRWFPEDLSVEVFAHENGEPLEGTELCRWYTYLPGAAFAPNREKKIPLLLLLHGHCDAPQAVLEHCGFLELCGKEQVAILTPDHQDLLEISPDNMLTENKVRQLDKLVEHTLQSFPNLDRERVYVSGFSRGSRNTCFQSLYNTGRYAAAAPLSGLGVFGRAPAEPCHPFEAWQRYMSESGTPTDMGLPAYVLLCGLDSVFADIQGLRAHLNLDRFTAGGYGGAVDALNALRTLNGLPLVKDEDYDFTRYPFWGFPLENESCTAVTDTLFREGELTGKDGSAVMRFAVADGLEHALYPAYAGMMWRFVKQFRRDSETGKICRITE